MNDAADTSKTQETIDAVHLLRPAKRHRLHGKPKRRAGEVRSSESARTHPPSSTMDVACYTEASKRPFRTSYGDESAGPPTVGEPLCGVDRSGIALSSCHADLSASARRPANLRRHERKPLPDDQHHSRCCLDSPSFPGSLAIPSIVLHRVSGSRPLSEAAPITARPGDGQAMVRCFNLVLRQRRAFGRCANRRSCRVAGLGCGLARCGLLKKCASVWFLQSSSCLKPLQSKPRSSPSDAATQSSIVACRAPASPQSRRSGLTAATAKGVRLSCARLVARGATVPW